MKWLIPAVFLFSACSLIYCADFIEVGKKLTAAPGRLRGEWRNVSLVPDSYIEEISIEKSYFSIKYSGSDRLSDAISVSDPTVRISFCQPFYIVQVTTEKGVSVSALTLSGDTLKLFKPNLPTIEQEFKLRKRTGLFGVSELVLDTASVRMIFSDPAKYLLPGDSFTKPKREH